MRKKASHSYHSTAIAVFSHIFVTLSPLVLRNLLIHVAANEDVSQLPEMIISPFNSWLITIKSHPDRLIRLVRANPLCLGGTLVLHLTPTPHSTLPALDHLFRTLLYVSRFTFAIGNSTLLSHVLLNSQVRDALAMLSEKKQNKKKTWQMVVNRWEFNVNNGKYNLRNLPLLLHLEKCCSIWNRRAKQMNISNI